MPSYTTNELIPYPVSTDSACSVDDVIASAADVISARLGEIDAVLNEALNVDVFRVEMPAGATVYNGNYTTSDDMKYLSYSIVALDPNGITSLDRDDHAVTLSTPTVGGGVFFTGVLGEVGLYPADTLHTFVVDSQVGTYRHDFRGRNASTDPASGSMQYSSHTPAGSAFTMRSYYLNGSSTTSGSVNSHLVMWGFRKSR